MNNLFVKAIVQKVIPKGNHGPYAVASSDEIEGSITFSLEPTVWQEADWPKEGMVVFLSNLRQKRAGWRAKTGRYWQPSDEQRAMGKPMQFLYPISKQYPFDAVCEKIIRELEKRNWQVPNITVEFDDYGSGEQKLRLVRELSGKNFRLYFCRVQRSMPGLRWNDTAAVTTINIPQKELHVHEDESGPSFYLYVGDDWERDRENFVYGSKVNSKLRKEPKTYLEYTGGWSTDPGYGLGYSNRRAPYLVHNNDLGREYDPEGDEPKYFVTSEVMAEFTKYLRQEVLGQILKYSIPEIQVDSLAMPETIPFPEISILGEIYTFGDNDDANRIITGQNNKENLELADRYGMAGTGYRLLSLGTPNDKTVPQIAYDGFLWCGLASTIVKLEFQSLEIPGYYRRRRDEYLIRIKPKYANGFYLADHGQYEKRRQELANCINENRQNDYFTDEEVADFMRARARTIIPISEYKGGFLKPVILINRELALDEVELVSGPHEKVK